jgi:hypothetical protein
MANKSVLNHKISLQPCITKDVIYEVKANRLMHSR